MKILPLCILFPRDHEHYILPILNAEEIFQLLATWFPIFGLPVSPIKFLIDLQALEQVRDFAKAKEIRKALDHLPVVNLNPVEMKNFVDAFANLKLSGIISQLSFQNNEVDEFKSINILTDGRTGWLISNTKTEITGPLMLSVRRTGADFAFTVREIAEKLTGTKLPRRQSDPSGKTTQFAVNLDELSMALIAINCTDLAQKMYSGLSGDSKGEHFTERMKKAQQSLGESGLCTFSERGLPVLEEEFAQAVFPVAGSNSMVQISFSEGGPTIDTAIYIVHGRIFTAYKNYGEYMQLLEYGKYKDLCSYILAGFPDIGIEKVIQNKPFSITYEALEKALRKASAKQEAAKTLVSEGATDIDAKLLAEDISDTSFRAILIRRDAPERKKKMEEKPKENKAEKHPRITAAPKSSRRSWLFEFRGTEAKGKATVTDREDFSKAIADLLA